MSSKETGDAYHQHPRVLFWCPRLQRTVAMGALLLSMLVARSTVEQGENVQCGSELAVVMTSWVCQLQCARKVMGCPGIFVSNTTRFRSGVTYSFRNEELPILANLLLSQQPTSQPAAVQHNNSNQQEGMSSI